MRTVLPTTVNRLPHNRLSPPLTIAGNGALTCLGISVWSPIPASQSVLGERLHGYADNGSGERGTRSAISTPILAASRGAGLQAPGSKLKAMTK